MPKRPPPKPQDTAKCVADLEAQKFDKLLGFATGLKFALQTFNEVDKKAPDAYSIPEMFRVELNKTLDQILGPQKVKR